MISHPHENAISIPRISAISPGEFRTNYIKQKQPVVITEMMQSWPAMNTWSLDYFAQLDADIFLERGNVMQAETHFERAGFREYIDQLIASEDRDGSQQNYLSVFDIFSAFPQLKDDVDFQLIAQFKLQNTISGWIGPAGTVTGYHIDWADNLFAQIYGRKRFFLVSPDQSKNMYPSSKFDYGSTLSEVDVLNYDTSRHPNFLRVKAVTTTLSPGEMLFIPRGWWHCVQSLDKSISVNNFGVDRKGLWIDETQEKIKARLHKYGLYGRECTCHMIVDGQRVAR